ncbi:serine hydrolase domain-containing protein [Brachybacterium phenoliresistens]|uniref:serine hydrolase domain-containing protein n=1 Tax=Brachybacterium phenoliresistens TaxID=396014 RepID=UPI0031D03C79
MNVVHRARGLLALLIVGVAVLAGCAGATGGAAPGTLPAPRAAEPASPVGLTEQDVNAWLDGRLPVALENGGVPGAVVTVVQDGRILTSRGYGEARTATADAPAVPVDPASSLFRVGSVSKLATDVAVLQLVEAGELDLDEDVSAYVDVPLERRFDGDITLRHLLTHTAGFEEHLEGLFVAEGEEFSLEEYVRHEPPTQIYAPGTTPAYSNYGLALAGYIVEETTGVPFEQYVQEHVFAPAGMSASTFAQPVPDALAPQVASGYVTADGPAQDFEIIPASPAGAMSASGEDMGRFLLALLGQGTGEPILSPEMLAQMQQPALDESSLGTLAQGQRMGLGLFDESRPGHRALGHGGDTNFFHSALEIYPDDGIGIFLSLNATGDDTAAYAIRDDLLAGFTDRYLPADGGAGSERPGTVPAAGGASDAGGAGAEGAGAEGGAVERAATVAGSYESTRAMATGYMDAVTLLTPVRITAVGDGRLVASGLSLSGPQQYEEISPWVWQEVGGHRKLAVQVEDGEVVRIGHDSAMSIVPVGPGRALLLPVLATAAVLLVLVLALWPLGAIRRLAGRVLGTSPAVPAPPLPWTAHLARAGGAVALLALVGWTVAIVSAGGFAVLPAPAIRGIQVAQAIGVLALVPATVDLVRTVLPGRAHAGSEAAAEVRPLLRALRRGRRVLGAVVLVAALAGIAWSAWGLHLFSLDVSV